MIARSLQPGAAALESQKSLGDPEARRDHAQAGAAQKAFQVARKSPLVVKPHSQGSVLRQKSQYPSGPISLPQSPKKISFIHLETISVMAESCHFLQVRPRACRLTAHCLSSHTCK